MDYKSLSDELQDLVDFHGHLCFGSLLGYKACRYAIGIIGQSENMVVVTENQNCGNDAVKLLLNCTPENGKLLLHKGNSQSWAFYNRDEEEGIRLTISPTLADQMPKDKDQAMQYLLELPGNIIFNAEPFDID